MLSVSRFLDIKNLTTLFESKSFTNSQISLRTEEDNCDTENANVNSNEN